MKLREKGFHYGWLILPVCLGNVMISHGLSNSFSVIFVHLLQESGLSRADLSGIFSIYILIFFCGGILVGPLLDTVGPRILIPAGSVIAALGLLGCSVITSPYTLYFYYGCITALGVCCMSWIPNSLITANWFPNHRGAAVGLVMCGSGLGMLLFIPLTQVFIDWAGWRSTFRILALVTVLAIAPANAVFQRIRPPVLSHRTGDGRGAGKTKPSEKNQQKDDWTLFLAIRQRNFWMICVAAFCNPFFTFSIMLHQVALVVEQGYDPLAAATRLGVVGVFTVVGRLASGALSDRTGRAPAYTLFMSFAALGLLSLLFLTPNHPWMLSAYVLFGGLGLGVGGAMFPTMLADMFPGASLGSIMGLISVFSGFGASLGSWLVGYSYDVTGTYRLGLILLFAAVWAAVFFVWLAAPRTASRTDSRRH